MPADDLLPVIRELTCARDLDTVTRVVRRAARKAAGADGATFVLREGDLCHYADEDAIAPLWKGRRFPMDSCISGWVMRHRTPAAIDDVYSDPRISADVYRPTFVKSLVMVPVRAEEPIAAIGAYWAVQHAATPAEVEDLQVIADAASLALANVELYAGLQAALARERHAREQAEAASRAKDEFLGILSHELRTPLNSILGWARVLRGGRMSGQWERGLEVIERNAQLQARMVEDLLDVSTIITGRLTLDPRPVDLVEVARQAVDALRTEAEAKRLTLTFGAAAPIAVTADPARLHQVVANLVSNAIKFTPPGGAVSVHVDGDGQTARIAVADTGEGIEPDVLPHVFDRFRQGNSRITRTHGGLGLGLAIARSLVERHGGRITAHSAGRGRGARFEVVLPRRDTR